MFCRDEIYVALVALGHLNSTPLISINHDLAPFRKLKYTATKTNQTHFKIKNRYGFHSSDLQFKEIPDEQLKRTKKERTT
jgi:hypothetical protein